MRWIHRPLQNPRQIKSRSSRHDERLELSVINLAGFERKALKRASLVSKSALKDLLLTHVILVFADVISGIAQEGLEIFPLVNSQSYL
jgi:hypothetical protein